MNDTISSGIAHMFAEIFQCPCTGKFIQADSSYEFKMGSNIGIITVQISATEMESFNVYRLISFMREKYNDVLWEKLY